MKFGETFKEYLQAHQERFIEESTHVEYKRLKKVLKSCRRCRDLKDYSENNGEDDVLSPCCQYESCPLCDRKFFSELTKEASDIAWCFSLRVRLLFNLQDHGIKRYITSFRQCFMSPHNGKAQECRMLVEYVMMNAVAMRKSSRSMISSDNGRKFKSKMRSEHREILQATWLIELGAFFINLSESNNGKPDEELVFKPYALGCGHLFCKLCACSAASVMIFQGLKAAHSDSRCPACREAGVYGSAVHMMELSLLLKKHCKEYWSERSVSEQAEMVKQSKIYWDLQSKYMIGYCVFAIHLLYYKWMPNISKKTHFMDKSCYKDCLRKRAQVIFCEFFFPGNFLDNFSDVHYWLFLSYNNCYKLALLRLCSPPILSF